MNKNGIDWNTRFILDQLLDLLTILNTLMQALLDRRNYWVKIVAFNCLKIIY